MKSYLLLFIIFGFLGSCTQKGNSEAVLLRLHYKKGDKKMFAFKQQTSGNSTMSMSNQIHLSFTVDSVINNGAEYVFTSDVTRMQADSDMGGEKETYDSDKTISVMSADEQAMHREFQHMLDNDFTISMNNRGAITSPFKFVNGGGETEPPLDFALLQLTFPEKEVRIGDSWKQEGIVKLTSSKNVFTYTVDKITKDEVKIKVDAEIGGVKGVTKDNEGAGEYNIDRKTGQLKNYKLEMPLQFGGTVTTTITAE